MTFSSPKDLQQPGGVEKKLIIGAEHGIQELQNYFRFSNVEKLMIVHGPNSYALSGAEHFFLDLGKSLICTHFSDFTPNPKFDDAVRGANLFLDAKCDAILAVGGGSVIDIAKIINVFQAHPNNWRSLALGDKKVCEALKPLVAVPTTAGSGSEATHFAVVYVDGVKYSIADKTMLPDMSILNPLFISGLEGRNLWSPAFDALCQSIESYWSASATSTSLKSSYEALQLLWSTVLQAPRLSASDKSNLLVAANLAGKAINETKTTAPHALSYFLSSKYRIPHGNAVGIFMKPFFSFNFEMAARGNINCLSSATLEKRMKEILSLMDCETPDEAEQAWQKAMERCGLCINLRDAGLQSEDEIKEIVKSANVERLGNHPVKLTQETLSKLVKNSY